MTATLTRDLPARTALLRTGGDGRTLSGIAVTYDVRDAYDTLFAPGVFAKSTRKRMPLLLWAHDPARPLGRVTSVAEDNKRMTFSARFDDPTEVPDVRQAIAQVRSGTVANLSVGFVPERSEMVTIGGQDYVRFLEATLHEVSLVVVGAVPGANITDLRNPRPPRDLTLEREAFEASMLAARRGWSMDDEADAAMAAVLARRL